MHFLKNPCLSSTRSRCCAASGLCSFTFYESFSEASFVSFGAFASTWNLFLFFIFNYMVFLCKDTSHVNGLLTVRGVACFYPGILLSNVAVKGSSLKIVPSIMVLVALQWFTDCCSCLEKRQCSFWASYYGHSVCPLSSNSWRHCCHVTASSGKGEGVKDRGAKWSLSPCSSRRCSRFCELLSSLAENIFAFSEVVQEVSSNADSFQKCAVEKAVLKYMEKLKYTVCPKDGAWADRQRRQA